MKSIVFILLSLNLIHLGQAQSLSNMDSIRFVLDSQNQDERLRTLVSLCTHPTENREQAKLTLSLSEEAKQLAMELNNHKDLLWIQIEEASAIGLLQGRQQSIDSLQKLLPAARALPSPKVLLHALAVLGDQQTQIDDLIEAKQTLSEALKIAIALPDSISMGFVYNNLGNVANHLSQNQEAIEYYMNALIIKEKQGSTKLAKTYSSVSQIFRKMGNYDESLRFNRKAMALQRTDNDIFGLSISYLNMGNTYRQMKNYDSSLYYNEGALKLSQSIQDTLGFAFAYYNIASVNFSLQKYRTSIKYYMKAYPTFVKAQMRRNAVNCLISTSINYRLLGDYTSAKTAIEQAQEESEELTSFAIREQLNETYYELYKVTGDYQRALRHHELFKAYSDSILNETKISEISRLQKNYEINNRDNQISLLDKENEIATLKLAQGNALRNWLLLLLALILLVAVILWSRYKLKLRTERMLSIKNEELEKLNSAKNKFFAIIAHDLRNPLSAFKMLTTGLANNIDHYSTEQLKEQLEELRLSSNQLSELLQNLLQWALSQTESMKINPQLVDLKTLLENNVRLIQSTAHQKNIEVSMCIEDKTISLIDEATIDLVFRNLLVNAVKFTNEKGLISISATEDQDYVKINIQDTGIGMSDQEQKQLFDITQDASKIGNSPNKGSGLGLILCDEFVKKNNGKLNLKSTLGRGSTFTLYLPKPTAA
ncbi:hypothetical protein BFP72_13855 [Reichenbachiella sp. 5M10]|uniref:ATP-binding protein n=1 Tax=Reichenbachiella sp. 5M10 TaxID=1889772 RepID=UPI000C14A571|nr:tetratricopeptide repeat-containing sensor histidine kinase [Reichenbachiella sp. 5M10]PIB36403.1 hypothetical protein BFP72_13855 [Reichenbachiella sp. 5M10]